jgi:hypothetical protein
MNVTFSKQNVYNKVEHARLMMALSAERPAIGVHKNVLFGLNLW